MAKRSAASVDDLRERLEALAATPGVDFDPLQGRKFIRFSYAGSSVDMNEAVKRLAAWRGPQR